jgi:hypothetical protein
MIDVADIIRRLTREGATTTIEHLRQAEAALKRSEWESASAQVRSTVEALFDHAAAVILKTLEHGGAARQELARAGHLSPRKAKLIQAFMEYAGQGGAHAGSSTPDEARGRFIAGLGLVLLGLDLLPELTLAQDAMAVLTHAPKDSALRTSCPTCGAEQLLSECLVRRDESDTVYECKNGCQVIVVVSATGDSPWPGRGWSIGNHVIRNARDIHIAVSVGGPTVLISASPSALMKHRPPS